MISKSQSLHYWNFEFQILPLSFFGSVRSSRNANVCQKEVQIKPWSVRSQHRQKMLKCPLTELNQALQEHHWDAEYGGEADCDWQVHTAGPRLRLQQGADRVRNLLGNPPIFKGSSKARVERPGRQRTGGAGDKPLTPVTVLFFPQTPQGTLAKKLTEQRFRVRRQHILERSGRQLSIRSNPWTWGHCGRPPWECSILHNSGSDFQAVLKHSLSGLEEETKTGMILDAGEMCKK